MANHIHEAFPYLRVRNANEAIEFYKMAFGAVEEFRLSEPSGRIGHAELKFGPHTVMVSDEYPEYGIYGPESGRPTGSSIHLHVDDVDALTLQRTRLKCAISAGKSHLRTWQSLSKWKSLMLLDTHNPNLNPHAADRSASGLSAKMIRKHVLEYARWRFDASCLNVVVEAISTTYAKNQLKR